MNKIYVLYRLEPRAETTDTLLYYASHDKGLLEEILLSLWEEITDVLKLSNYNNEEIKEVVNAYFNQFGIVSVMEVK